MGKLGQSTARLGKVHNCKDQLEVDKILSDKTINVTQVALLHQRVLQLHTVKKKNLREINYSSCLNVASFITGYSRIYMHKAIKKLVTAGASLKYSGKAIRLLSFQSICVI